MKKLAVFAPHPIYYQTPLWQMLANDPSIDLTVFFASKMSVGSYYDPEFGKTITWNLPVLEGYRHQFIKSIPAFVMELRRDHFDAILLNSWNSFGVWAILIAAKFGGVRVLLRSENPWNQEALKTGWRQAPRRIFLKGLFKAVNAFLYIGKENRELYLRYGVPEEKLFSTPYAVDNARLVASVPDTNAASQEVRRRLKIAEDDIVIIAVGKLIQKKRPLDLIKAYEALSTNNKALIIVGDGELRPSLEKYVTEHNIRNVHFAGFVGQADIGCYYAAADIFVLPSGAGETWGLVVNEALCFGLPIVISDMVGSAADLVRSGENGYTFPLGNIAELARNLALLIEQPALRAKFGQKSREIVREYSYEADVAGILKALA
jgi:glycosyltransferase involved in cell wall biosynthesis